VLFAQVCASGGAVASDCEVGFELASALLTNFELESLRVHRGVLAQHSLLTAGFQCSTMFNVVQRCSIQRRVAPEGR
jgi:hypothetical protein